MLDSTPTSGTSGVSPRAVVTVAALSLGLFVLTTVESLPIGLMPTIVADLGVSLRATGLLVTAYGLIVTIASVPLTRMVSRFNRKRLIITTVAVIMASTLTASMAPNYPVLLASRVGSALAHAVYWSVVASTATALFPRRISGRVVAALFIGPSLASVAGAPAGAWIGQHHGWRSPFALLALAAVAALVAVAATLPDTPPPATVETPVPKARAFWILMVTTGLLIWGSYTVYTYVSSYITDLGGLPSSAISPTLLGAGLAGLVGSAAAGMVVDRHPRRTLLVSAALLASATLALAFGTARPALVIGMFVLFGGSMGATITGMQSRVLQEAPDSPDLASAINSSTFNIGITGGSLLSGALLSSVALTTSALIGGLIALAAVAVLAAEPLLTRRNT